MTKYFVTGATGFIGSRLLGLLKTIDCDVRLLSRYQVDGYKTVICKLGEDKIPKHALESIDTVFHLAGFAHNMQDSSTLEHLYYLVNVEATVELAKLSVKSGVKKFVFVSSVKAGGLPLPGQCAREIDQSVPAGVYGKTKLEAELKLLKISKESGMHVSIIRPSLVYGPGVKGNLELMLSSIKKGRFPPLPETRNRRSMIHVDDLVKALFLISDDEYANEEVFIATDGIPYSSRDIYISMCKVLGRSVAKWSVPKFLFSIFALTSRKNKYKVDKLFADEYYSSKKLESLGFEAQRKLIEMNETSF